MTSAEIFSSWQAWARKCFAGQMLSFPFSSPSLVNIYYEKKTLTNIFKLRVGMKCCIYLQRMQFLLSTCKDHSSSCSHGVELNGENSELNFYNEFETDFISPSDRPCFPSYHFSGMVLLLMSLMSLVLLYVTVGITLLLTWPWQPFCSTDNSHRTNPVNIAKQTEHLVFLPVQHENTCYLIINTLIFLFCMVARWLGLHVAGHLFQHSTARGQSYNSTV